MALLVAHVSIRGAATIKRQAVPATAASDVCIEYHAVSLMILAATVDSSAAVTQSNMTTTRFHFTGVIRTFVVHYQCSERFTTQNDHHQTNNIVNAGTAHSW